MAANFARMREQTMSSHEEEEAVTVNTRALIDKVLARYSGEWTTLRELIQNAADAQAKKVTIRFETLPSASVPLPQSQNPSDHLRHVLLHHTLKTLLVSNDGDIFGENDWQRLKRIAEGNPDETKIGAFGVGFYSVFADCETPFVSSGKQTMAFYWKKDSLFTRRGKLPEDQASDGTTFLLDYRSQSTPVPPLLSLCQFLATSLTFVGLECIDLYLDDWNILKLTKKMAPGASVSIPKDVNPKTRDGLMKIVDVEYQNAQIDARWMNVVGWNRTMPAATVASAPQPQNDASGGSLRSWFNRFTAGTGATSTVVRKAQREEEVLQQALMEDLAGFSQATVFLRLSTVNVQTYVSKQLSAELERATKKPPPKHTRIAILTSSFDESAASISTGTASKQSSAIFASVLPTKSGKIFIGFPTAQTTGLLAHISAPSVIPTVERESIDLNARYVRDWNVEMLRVAGIACRIAYTGEMAELKAKLERTMSASGNKKVAKDDLAAVMPAAVHAYKQYNYDESTPSAKVGQYIEEAFWMCNQKASIDVLSTRGVLPSQQVRVATEDLSFVEGIPVVPDEIMLKANEFLTKLREYGLLSDITTSDIKKELEAQALTEKQVTELVKWACNKVSQGELDSSMIQTLFDGTVAGISEEYVNTSSSPVLQLGNLKSFVNVTKIPAEMPTPPQTIPFRLTKGLTPKQLEAIGWEELQIVPWLRWIIESDGHGFGASQSLTSTPAVASQVLPVISKSWEGLSNSSKQTVTELLVPRTVIPTKLGMRKPPQSYFASVKLFEDLPTIVGLQGVKEKFLGTLGVRKTVELNVVFARLMAKGASSAVEEGKWSHHDLIKYLVSVKDDIPQEDLKRLRNTPICPAETTSGNQVSKGKLYRLSELYEPSEPLRKLGLPLLQWPGPYRSGNPEGRFLKALGLQPFPSVQDIVDILSKAPTNSELQQSTITYFIINYHQNGYSRYPMAGIQTAFIPVQGFAGEGNNLIAKPSQCYANPAAAVLRFRTIRHDLIPHAAVFGVAPDPAIDVAAERLIKNPPANVAAAKVLYAYFVGRLNEIGPSGNLAEKLGDALIVPIADRREKRPTGVRYVAPRAVFVGDGSSTYGDIFDFVDFGEEANTFLLRIGSKHEPSAAEIAGMLVRQPTRLLETLGSDKYLQLLRKIAENAANLKKDKSLWQQLKQAPCLIAVREVVKTIPSDNEKARDVEEEEMFIKEYSLASAPAMVIIDDFGTYRLFQSSLLTVPEEETLENLYSALETPFLSKLVEDDQRMGAIIRDQSPAQKLQKLLVERCRLFLHDHTADVIRHDAKWLEQSLTVKCTEFLQITRRLKGYKMQFIEKRTAALHRESKKDATLYVTARYDLYEVARAIMSLLLKRPRQQDYLALETIMESDLRRLKTKGYNVDRILRQRAAESRIAESERQKREDEQRRVAEAESASRAPEAASRPPQDQKAQDHKALTNGMQSLQIEQTPETPERQLSMPGAFADSPEQTPGSSGRGKKGVFSNITRALGISNASPAGQQMQNMLTNGQAQDLPPPPYEAHDPNGGKALAPGTERVSSPRDLQQNLQSAIKASRSFNSSSLFTPPQTNKIQETQSYCDSKPGHDLNFISELNSGIKLFLTRNTRLDPNAFLQTNKDAIAQFVYILVETATIFELSTQTLNIFYDEAGASIAFNSNGSLFCNLRYFMQLHMAQMGSSEGKVEACAYWWITLCHELAHNLVKEHSAQHSFYTESFVAHYFRRMLWWAGRQARAPVKLLPGLWVTGTFAAAALDHLRDFARIPKQLFLQFCGEQGGLRSSPHTANIKFSSNSSSTRQSANIPLHTLRRGRRSSNESFDEKDEDRRRLRRSSGSFDDDADGDAGSEFSLWSDTGDLVDQLAEEEDPLAVRTHRSFEEHHSPHRRGRSQQKKVRYADSASQEKPSNSHRPGVDRKEDIRIPSPPPQKIGWGQRLLSAAIMPNDSHARMHGLHGKKLIYFLSIFVSLGVFLFGYDQGVMSGIITGPYFKDYFHQPTRAEIGTMVAILEVGAFIASLVVGRIGDVIGRRKTILYGAVVFVIGGACQAFATGMPMMMLGRIVAGFGVGALSTIVPVYQSEISPPHNRGKLACIEFSGNIFGYMCSVWVDYGCSYIKSDWAWRLPLLMQVVMGGLLAVGSFLIVESPRWLLDNDHDEEGIVVIANLYGKGDIHNPKARDEYREIKMNVLLQRQEGERSYSDMFRRYYKRVFIAMSAQSLAQLNGINVISYYAPLVFEQAGWVGRDALLMTGVNGITYLASTVPTWYLVDRLGRRFILLSGAVAMIISLSAISYFIYIDIHVTPTMVVIFVMIYNAAFGFSWGPIPWLYPPEILPLSIRAKGASLSTAANWAFNWLVGEMTPILQEAIKWRLYLLHAFFCAVSFVVVWFIYPETANVRLEDMNSIFGDATTIAPTPETLAEVESLFSGSNRSPVPSFHLGDDGEQVPDMALQPPDVEIQDGKPMLSKDSDSQREGVGGWISNIVKRNKGEEANGNGKYKPVGQDDQEEQ